MLRTNEKYQNRGYGSLLVNTMVEEVKSRGLIPVVLIEGKSCQEYYLKTIFSSKLGFLTSSKYRLLD